MAKLPIGRRSPSGKRPGTSSGISSGSLAGAGANVAAANLEELTRNAGYIIDAAGQKQAIVVEWSAWQAYMRRVGASDAVVAPQTTQRAPAGGQSDYALRREQADVDLYRPTPASSKEAADFTLETNVTRSGGE